MIYVDIYNFEKYQIMNTKSVTFVRCVQSSGGKLRNVSNQS